MKLYQSMCSVDGFCWIPDNIILFRVRSQLMSPTRLYQCYVCTMCCPIMSRRAYINLLCGVWGEGEGDYSYVSL